MKKLLFIILVLIAGVCTAQDTTYITRVNGSLIKHQEQTFPDGKKVVTDDPLTRADFSNDLATVSAHIHAAAAEAMQRNDAAAYLDNLDKQVKSMLGFGLLDSVRAEVAKEVNAYTWKAIPGNSPAKFSPSTVTIAGKDYAYTPYSNTWLRIADYPVKGRFTDLFLWRGSFVAIDYSTAIVATGKNLQPKKRTVISRREPTRQ